jgi:hypothetical protein
MTEEEPQVVMTVYMSPEDYIAIKKNASWFGKSVAEYLVEHSMGRIPKGC